jgi:hypothetical protein
VVFVNFTVCGRWKELQNTFTNCINHACQQAAAGMRPQLEQDYDRIAARWIRFPSHQAVLAKLQDCDILRVCRDPTQRVFSISSLHQLIWLQEFDRVNSSYDDDEQQQSTPTICFCRSEDRIRFVMPCMRTISICAVCIRR